MRCHVVTIGIFNICTLRFGLKEKGALARGRGAPNMHSMSRLRQAWHMHNCWWHMHGSS